MAVKALIFDIDGTLYPNRAMMIRSSGFFLRHLYLIYHFNIVRKDLRKVGRIEHFEATQAGMLAARMGIHVDDARKLIDGILYKKWERVFRRVKPFPELKKTLQQLADQGLRFGILSDFPIGKKMEYFGLQDLPWEFQFSSRDSGYLKPSIRPFLHCIETMQLQPHEILYVGNSYSYDVVGSRKAGMKTAWLTGSSKGKQADIIFDNYRVFAQKLTTLL
ncbi:MAG: HAD family hydrolase [Spirochaetaceae bacterium]|jgi:putative hydrolase of the HAD superfamily|nr:HAD family hydrolase [Spirochaetaceae bacterium]